MLLLAGLVAVWSVVWFGVNAQHEVGPGLLLWLSQPVSALLGAVAYWRLGYLPGIGAAATRFWRALALTGLVVAVGTVTATVDAIGGPGPPRQRMGQLTLGIFGLAVLVVIWAMLRLPFATTSLRMRVALWLDISTVVLTAAVFIWQFSTRPQLNGEIRTGTPLLSGLVVMVVGLVAVFALIKVTMSGSRTVDAGALRLLALGMALGCLGGAPFLLPQNKPYLVANQYTIPVVFFVGVWAAHRQRNALLRPPPERPSTDRRRTFSALPYSSVAATNALLLWLVARRDFDSLEAVAGCAVVLMAIVTVRQVLAFHENGVLLSLVKNQERRFRSLVQNSSDVTVIVDRDGAVTYLSPAAERVLGLDVALWTGQGGLLGVHPDDRTVMSSRIAEISTIPNATASYHVRLAHQDGSWRWAEIISANLIDEPSVAGIVSNVRDVTETRRFQDRLRHEATHDALTGLANRVLFRERLDAALAAGPAVEVTVALIDLDDFKTVNDTLGHGVGDELLRIAAQRLQGSLQPADVVARLGGDEFAVVLQGMTVEQVDTAIQRVIAAFAAPVSLDGHDLTLHGSIGLSINRDDADASELLRRADVAMYAAKRRADGRHVRFISGMQTENVADNSLAEDLHTALATDQLRLVYQPVMTLVGRELTAVEALVRWHHPQRGELQPDQFIPVAEKTGLIVPLGAWVLQEACRQLADWRDRYPVGAPIAVNVNVSVRQLTEPGFCDLVLATLADTGIDAQSLVLEITESIPLSAGLPVESLQRLRSSGVQVSLDDFGTGRSSLSVLQICPVDEIKLDRSFVTSQVLAGTPDVAAAVAQLANALGLRIVAEGVETAEQADRLQQLGYLLAQGYHLAHPMSPEQISAMAEATGTSTTAPIPD